MKALLSRRCGGPETLVMADVPEPAAGQVRIAVRACGINYPDVLMIEDKYQFRPERPFSPGVLRDTALTQVPDVTSALRLRSRPTIESGLLGRQWVGVAEDTDPRNDRQKAQFRDLQNYLPINIAKIAIEGGCGICGTLVSAIFRPIVVPGF